MTDNINKGFWERMARIYTAFMSKNDTAYSQRMVREKLSSATG